MARRSTSKVLRILSIRKTLRRKTQCRNLIIGNRYGGLPKRFTRKNPRILSIRGFFRRNHVLQMKLICKTQCRRLRLLISMEFCLNAL